MVLTIDDRCPRCWQVDYLPLDDLKARCRRCKTVYQRRELEGNVVALPAARKAAGWSIGRVLQCPECGHPAYMRVEGSGRRCWSCNHVWDPETVAVVREATARA